MSGILNWLTVQHFISVQVAKPYYVGGEEVEGSITVGVVSPLTLNSLQLTLKGVERVHVKKEILARVEKTKIISDARGTVKIVPDYDIVPKTMNYDETHCLVKSSFNLLSSPQTFNPGTYVFPFRFVLDQSTSGSFKYSSIAQDIDASLTYTLAAKAVPAGISFSHLKASTDISVREPARQALMPTELHREMPVTFLCCFNKGNISMSAFLDKNAYVVGETAHLRLIVDNSQSSVNLRKCKFRLWRSMDLTADGYREVFREKVCESHAPPVLSGQIADIGFPLPLPPGIPTTTSGRLIITRYWLQIKLDVPFSTDLEIEVPVQIYNQPAAPAAQPSCPSFPQEGPPTYMSTVNIDAKMFETCKHQIEGFVNVSVDDGPFRFEKLILHLYGIETVHLQDASDGPAVQIPTDEQSSYHERKIFYEELILNISSEQFKEKSLPPGITSFKFRCVLGSTTPGSMAFATTATGNRVSARLHYEFVADLTSPGLFTSSQRLSRTALEYRQLPMTACTPVQVIADATIGKPWLRYLLCMPSLDADNVEIFLGMNCNYYVLNDQIRARLRIFNKSARDIVASSISLVRRIVITAMQKTVTEEHIVTKVELGRVPAHQSIEMRCLLSTPSKSPFTTKGHLISCHYELVTRMRPSWSVFSTQHRHPIEIYDLKLPQYMELASIQMSPIK